MNARTTNPHGVAFGSEFGGGMSFREYVATQAMVGILAMHADESVLAPKPDWLAEKSVVYADALIAELNMPQKKED